MYRYRDPQLQVGDNNISLILRQNICKSWCLKTHFVPNNSDSIVLYNGLQMTIVVLSG